MAGNIEVVPDVRLLLASTLIGAANYRLSRRVGNTHTSKGRLALPRVGVVRYVPGRLRAANLASTVNSAAEPPSPMRPPEPA